MSVFPLAASLHGSSAEAARTDLVAGVTLAPYAIPVALAYAALAGLPPQLGIYGYMLGFRLCTAGLLEASGDRADLGHAGLSPVLVGRVLSVVLQLREVGTAVVLSSR